jgi:heme exporter protein A
MDGPTPLLTAENLTLVRGGRQLFAGVSLSLVAGQFLLLRGPNGAGKSSLLLTLAGLLRPAHGTIGPQEHEPLHILAHSSAVKSRLTLAENLAFWRRVNGPTGLSIEAALERVGLGGLGAIDAGHLSAGQTRRLALARLLVTDRRIWLLD